MQLFQNIKIIFTNLYIFYITKNQKKNLKILLTRTQLLSIVFFLIYVCFIYVSFFLPTKNNNIFCTFNFVIFKCFYIVCDIHDYITCFFLHIFYIFSSSSYVSILKRFYYNPWNDVQKTTSFVGVQCLYLSKITLIRFIFAQH